MPTSQKWMRNGRTFIAVVCSLLGVLAPLPVFAVNPLVTDDADPVEYGRLQLNTGWQFSRTASVKYHALPINPVLGIHPRGEFGLTFGHQWRHGHGTDPDTEDTDGSTDLVLASKWRLWRITKENFTLGARLDLKVPTASEDRGLGTGRIDVGAVLIATRNWVRTSLDWNVGYTATDASRSVFGDDQWFFGQTVRHQLNERWTLIGEAYTLLPHKGTANVNSTAVPSFPPAITSCSQHWSAPHWDVTVQTSRPIWG